MASKLVPQNEAATMLGVSPDDLNNIRLRGEINGYRDGAGWKFKSDDLDRLKAKRDGGDEEEDEFDLINVGGDDILVSDDEPIAVGGGDDEDVGTSTIVGKKKAPVVDDSATGGDAIVIGGDDVDEDAPSVIMGSDTNKPAGMARPSVRDSSQDILAGAIGTGSASDIQLEASDILGTSDVLGSDAGGSSNKGSSIFGGSSNVLVESGDSQIVDDDPKTVVKRGDGGASSNVLGGGDDDDDVLGGGSSDVTHRPQDSGILLVDPGDSGLSLDSPPDLTTGSGSIAATTDFELGDADSTPQADDDFLLTPLEESSEDESDSGSQVIMLDTEGEGDFGEATATLLSTQIPGLLEEESPLGGGFPSGGFTGGGATTSAAPGMMMVSMPREVPFPGWMVALLAVCTVTLGLSGAMMYDLMLNMWSWDGTHSINSALMDMIVGK